MRHRGVGACRTVRHSTAALKHAECQIASGGAKEQGHSAVRHDRPEAKAFDHRRLGAGFLDPPSPGCAHQQAADALQVVRVVTENALLWRRAKRTRAFIRASAVAEACGRRSGERGAAPRCLRTTGSRSALPPSGAQARSAGRHSAILPRPASAALARCRDTGRNLAAQGRPVTLPACRAMTHCANDETRRALSAARKHRSMLHRFRPGQSNGRVRAAACFGECSDRVHARGGVGCALAQ